LLAQMEMHFGSRVQMAYVSRDAEQVVIDFKVVE
ncbi:MAG: hypothetical protein K0S28_2475, partial [Paucimonas sp.]|nr:hypothetical protein [Paucimonas sp.]